MKIYNTLSRKIELIKPIKDNLLGIYTCGPTVYDYAHLGHLRKYTLDDILVRALRHEGFQVRHVQNVTDVGHLASDADTGEDKIEKGAKKYQLTVFDLAKKFEKYFYNSMDLMGNMRPNVICRATENIKEQINLVKKLEEKGFTYEIKDDGIYFDTSKLKDYGKLARLSQIEIKEGARVEKVKGKRHPTDFALWKFERQGENRAMVWKSPWHKRSFPGWHIECSAMSIKYLGEQFEIHTGGIDHIQVHHTNEIAQTEAATGKEPFVKYWVHHNMLLVNSEKMSKSLNNFITIDDVIAKGFDPRALRLLFMFTHYRSEQNFTWEALKAAQTSFDKLYQKVITLKKDIDLKLSEAATKFQTDFFAYINDDLKLPEALGVMFAMLKSQLSDDDKYQLLINFDQVLGLGMAAFEPVVLEIPEKIKILLRKRLEAKQYRDFLEADKIRTQISELGFEVIDLPNDEQKVIKSNLKG